MDDSNTCAICISPVGETRFDWHKYPADVYRPPNVTHLACAHSYCTACMAGYALSIKTFKKTSRRVACPLCRHVTRWDVQLPGPVESLLSENRPSRRKVHMATAGQLNALVNAGAECLDSSYCLISSDSDSDAQDPEPSSDESSYSPDSEQWPRITSNSERDSRPRHCPRQGASDDDMLVMCDHCDLMLLLSEYHAHITEYHGLRRNPTRNH